MKLQVIKNQVLYWLKSLALYGIYISVLLLLSSFFLLQIPAVQTRITKGILSSVSNKTGFKTTVGQVEFYWFDRIMIERFAIVDPEGNTMIGAHRLQVNFSFNGIFGDKNIRIDAVAADSARVFLTRIQETDSTRNLNINVFSKRLRSADSKSTATSSSINIGEAILQHSTFAYATDQDSVPSGFDYNHFTVNLHEAELQRLLLQGDTVQFNVASFQATETHNNFNIRQLETFFRYSENCLEFRGLNLQAGKSLISDTLVFTFADDDDLDDFVNKVSIRAHFTKTILHPNDLALFFPETRILPHPLQLSGNITGSISDFHFTDMAVETGNTRLNGTLQMEGLPDINETFIVLTLQQSQVDFTDLGFVMNEAVTKRLKPLGRVKLTGQFLGYPTDFVATGNFASSIGHIHSDINLKLDESDFDQSTYRGRLALTDFHLGKYLNDTTNFQLVSMDGQIDGYGLTFNAADFTLKGSISALGIKGYTYTAIETNARFASQLFKGKLSVDDPNLQLSINGSVDLRNSVNRFDFTGVIDTLNLDKINLAPRPLFIHTKMDVAMQGLVLDSLRGKATLSDITVVYKDESLNLNQITLEALRNQQQRRLNLYTTVADAAVSGNFYFSDLFTDLQRLLKEFYLNIENNQENITAYYANKKQVLKQYHADFSIQLKDIQSVMELSDIPLSISKNTHIEGRFSNGQTTNLQAFTRFDSITYGSQSFFKNQVEISASKIADSTRTLAMIYIQSASQQLASNTVTDNLTLEAIWDSHEINIEFGLRQKDALAVTMHTSVNFLDSTYIRFRPSAIKLLEQTWSFDPTNEIVIKGKEWAFRHVTLTNQRQTIGLTGKLSADSARTLTLFVKDFDMQSINPLIARKIQGITNATVILTNYYGQPTIQNKLTIRELIVDGFLIGDITGNNLWDPEVNLFNLNFFIDRLGNRIVNCDGHYNPAETSSPLNVTARLKQANLKIFEPFLDELFSKFEGTITGNYSVTGTVSDPKLNGSGRVENGGLVINYLNTAYQFNGLIGLTPSSIYFEEVNLTDAFRNRGELQGTITHYNFGNMEVNLVAKFTDFQVLNTTAQDNTLFYGQAYATGDVSITGPVNNLKITANATTRKNTKLFIPVSGMTTTEQKDFITFVSFTDSTYLVNQQKEIDKRINLTGLTIDFNIDVTPDAYCEIIFDLKAGDIIRGRGTGKLKLQLDTQGEFNMFGPLEFTEGWYNFTLYDIINKEFQVKPGSRITWYGDPYQAVLNIDAAYNQLASLAPILSDPTLSEVTQIKRKYPVQVLLKLEGPMLAPQITFDIDAKDLPKSIPVDGRPPVALDLEFYSFKSKMDEQELKKQVFSLIILRRFSPLESSISMSGSVANSVSELLSNQLSYWMSQVDENLVIDVDLGTMDQETFNTFQLRLSYTFLNGRLRVTGDGTFNNQPGSTTSGNQQSNAAPVAGDWTVDYLLTPDGTFKVKMFSRTNVNQLATNTANQTTLTTGVSLMYTRSFNELKDLLKASRNRNLRKPEEDTIDEPAKENEGN
ncbi:MAG: translocation/assembly module TamB [Flammeovirgaceae bacterium]|nr:MAG: translocation/assembly module TamB [Flammeovirgaceae bacterium]